MLRKDVNIDELIEEARKLDEDKTIVYHEISEVKVLDPVEHQVKIGADTYKLTDLALRQFLGKIKIPYNYYLNCTPDLREEQLAEALTLHAPRNVKYGFRVKEDTVYGLVPKVYYKATTSAILEKILPSIPNSMDIHSFYLDLEKVQLRFVVEKEEHVPQDLLNSMIDIGFSEVNVMPFTINSGLFREVCSNGLMLKEGMAPSFKMSMSRFNENVLSDAISSIPDRFYTTINHYAITLEETKKVDLDMVSSMDNVPTMITEMLDLLVPSRLLQRDYKIPILDRYNLEGNYTLNGLINAISRTSRDLDVDDKFKLERSAGHFLTRLSRYKQKLESENIPFDYTTRGIKSLFEE